MRLPIIFGGNQKYAEPEMGLIFTIGALSQIHCASKSSPILFLLLLGQILTDKKYLVVL